MHAVLTELSLSAASRTAWSFGAGASRCAPDNVPTRFSLMARFSAQPVAGATPARRQHFRDVRARPAPEENQAAPDEFERAISEYRALFADDLRVWEGTPRGFGDFVRALRP